MLTAGAEAQLAKLVEGRKVAIVGVGNRLRGDDAVGSVVAEALMSCASEQVLVIDAETVPENYLGTLLRERPELVLFVDAVDFGGKAGEWQIVPLSALQHKIPTTHTVSLKLLGEILAREGIDSWLLAIQPEQIAFGAPLSPSVTAAVQQLVNLLKKILLASPVPRLMSCVPSSEEVLGG